MTRQFVSFNVFYQVGLFNIFHELNLSDPKPKIFTSHTHKLNESRCIKSQKVDLLFLHTSLIPLLYQISKSKFNFFFTDQPSYHSALPPPFISQQPVCVKLQLAKRQPHLSNVRIKTKELGRVKKLFNCVFSFKVCTKCVTNTFYRTKGKKMPKCKKMGASKARQGKPYYYPTM